MHFFLMLVNECQRPPIKGLNWHVIFLFFVAFLY